MQLVVKVVSFKRSGKRDGMHALLIPIHNQSRHFKINPTSCRLYRVYFCCVSSDIDVQKLFDYLVGSGVAGGHGWKYHLYNDVLHLYKPGMGDSNTTSRVTSGSSCDYVKVRDSDYYFNSPKRCHQSDEDSYGASSSAMDTNSSEIVYREHSDAGYSSHYSDHAEVNNG